MGLDKQESAGSRGRGSKDILVGLGPCIEQESLGALGFPR